MESALIARLQTLVREDVELMAAAPEGPIAYFLHTSVMANDPIDRAILATSRLAQGGNPATATLPEVGLTSPQTMPMSVVLPAPLGPSRAKISPCRISRSTFLSAVSPEA